MTTDLSSFSIEQKFALREVMLKRAKLARTNGIALYQPHPKQDKFHRLGNFKYRYLRTGNRFGKSDCGSAEDIAWALGERPWYPEGDPARYVGIPRTCTKGLIICTDWGKAEEVFTAETEGLTQGKLWKWLPKASLVRRDTDHSGHIHKITIRSKWGGESTIYIDTVAGYKINEQRGESNWYDWIHVDEPIPEDMWNAYSRGLIDHDGSAWFTCTPLREPWINRFFLPSNRTPLDPMEPNIFPNTKGVNDRVVLVGTSFDNPYTSVEGIESYVEKLSDRDKAARLFGKPIDQSGAVHPWFGDHHVYTEVPPGWEEMNRPPGDYTVRVHIDFHPVTPVAVLFAATSPDGQVFFYDEIFEHGTPAELAYMIHQKTKNNFVAQVWMDPSGFVQNNVYQTSFADDLADEGIIAEKASKDLNRGIIMTNQALQRTGFLKFASNLRETLYEFDNYIFQDPLKRPDKPVDKNDHMMEGLHRLVIGGLDYVETSVFDSKPVRDSANYLLSL